MKSFILKYARENFDVLFDDARDSGDKYINDYHANEYIWEQLRCLITSCFLMYAYRVDTAPADNFMLELYNEFKPTVSFEQFENYMYKFLV